MRSRLPLAAAGAALLLAVRSASAQLTTPLDSTTLDAFRWRSIGPAVMGGRVTDIEVDPTDRRVWYVASAAGGIWKTVNNGVTFLPLFDKEKVVSMGDLAIAPSNPQILYAGTGEEDSRNSISPGGGIFKSTDGGKTWSLAGLEATQQIGRVIVHPTNPDIVWVAALGHAWSTNPERGIYKTTDGGKSWQLVKFVSDKAGFVDLAIDPSNPDVLYASSWERVRGPYFLKSGGPGSALWKTTDGGKTWSKLEGGGFPATMKGRIGLAIAASNPQTIYATVEADTLPNPTKLEPWQAPDTAKRQKPASGLYRSADGGKSWSQVYRYEGDARPFYYSQVRVDPKDPNRVYWMSSVFRFSDDGGKTVRRGALSIHTDWHAMWIDPHDPDFYLIGDDGGIAVTYDRGGTYDFVNTFPMGQFYDVSFDMAKPYRVCGGLQDNGSWCGPSRTRTRFGITNGDWFNVGGGDGFYTAQDPTNPNVVYAESQGGNISRLDLESGLRTPILRGRRREPGYHFEDSLVVARGDTAQPPTAQVKARLAEIRGLARADSALNLRFNWETPFFLSPHAPATIYVGGNRLLKSTDRGDHWTPISPDLSTRDSARIIMSTRQTGGITNDATGAETNGTITTVAESPIRPGLLWLGTDDGNVWLTRDDGGHWENLTDRFKGTVPAKTWVTKVEPSAFDTATVYISFDNHRENDFRPYVFVSTDFGKTFRSLARTLPQDGPAFVHVIREDPHDRDLLFAGTDVGAYVSTDRGASWQRFMNGLPTVPVHDLEIHPRDHELIAGTHGRSIFIVDIAPLEEMSDSVMKRAAHFFTPKPAYQYAPQFLQAWNGNKIFQAENPPYGAELAYRLTSGGKNDSVRVVVTNVAGDTVSTFKAKGGPGLHRAYWDLRGMPEPLGPAARRDSIITARLKERRADSLKAARKDTTAEGTTGAPRARGRGEPNLRPAELPAGREPESFAERFGLGQRRGKYVDAGDYLVTIMPPGGQALKRVVHVERIGDVPDREGFAEEGDDP